LVSSQLGEFNTHGSVVGLQDSDAHFSLLLLITLVLGLKCEFSLVLLIVDDWLHVLLLAKMLVKSLFDHVGIISGEEFSFVAEQLLVIFESLRWLHE